MSIGFWKIFQQVSLPFLLFGLVGCEQNKQPAIAVIPKAQSHFFWQAVHAGAVSAANETGYKILWNGPASEADFAHQIRILSDMINRRVSGILIAPSDGEALVPAIERAHQAGIPLTIIDSGANAKNYVSYVSTNNYEGGVMAARRMGKILEGKGQVAVVGLMPGSVSTVARETGLRETLEREFPMIELVAFQYGMSNRAQSLAAAEDILTAHPNLNGIFGSAEPGTIGVVQAVKARQLTGKVKIVGFDTSPSLVEDLRMAIIDSLVLQDPFNMAILAFSTLTETLKGGTPPRRVDMEPILATSENFRQPNISRLLNPQPNIDRYLK